MGRLSSKGARILTEQFQDRDRSRALVKENNKGRNARYDTISSRNSLKKHLSEWQQFAKWGENQGVTTLEKVTPDLVKAFICDEIKLGRAEKTLKSRITAINHVMVGTGV